MVVFPKTPVSNNKNPFYKMVPIISRFQGRLVTGVTYEQFVEDERRYEEEEEDDDD